MLKALRAQGIHTAMETNLHFPFEQYEEVLPYLDLLIFDIKHADDGKHRAGTGVDNELILANAVRLAGPEWAHLPLIVHTPVIPGYNDTEADIAAIARLLKNHSNLLYYELLAYHPLGVEKCLKLGMEPQKALAMPSREQMQTLGMAAARILPRVKANGNAINPYPATQEGAHV